ncbi:MAG: hypothetical protein Q8Q08_02870 [Candidatus Omnitrophota bacterium]|nr:hypothetical protein [Candidatus Omnitrophota bacterium]MDZ4241542.1 hypothetical protein [Candidatus Omnitrophota bacterium]
MKRLLIGLAFLLGSVSPSVSEAKVLVPFSGRIDPGQKTFEFIIGADDNRAIALKAEQTADRQYQITVNIDHLKTPVFEISSVLEIPLEIGRDEKQKVPKISGKIWSNYTLVNFQPVRELSGQFEFRNNTIFIHYLLVGSLTCKGSFSLADPYPVNMTVQTLGIDIGDFLAFWLKEGAGKASGPLAGELLFSGPLSRVQVKGSFLSEYGTIKTSTYQNFVLNFEGVFPFVQLTNSSITNANGFTSNVTGQIDIRDLANLDRQIKGLKKEAIVSQEGDNLEWTLKRIKGEKGSATELKYLKTNDGSPGNYTQDEDDMIGVERKVSF